MTNKKAKERETTRRVILRHGMAMAGAGLSSLAPFRQAFACHTYVSPVDGKVGCGAFNRDAASPPPDDVSELPPTPECEPPAPPPPPPASANSALPYDGQYVGCHIFAGNLGNTRYSQYHAHRFRAERTGEVAKVRWLNQYNLERPGYHEGNGGRISVEVRTDAGGFPSGTVLGQTAIVGPAVELGRMPLVNFQSPIQLTQGQIYHLVYRQHASSQGIVSIDDLDLRVRPETYTIYPPLMNVLASIAWRSPGSGKPPEWTIIPTRIPIFELHYTDGKIKGQGWVNGGRNHTAEIQGSRQARQEFPMGGTSRRVSEIAFLLYRKTNAGGDLTLQIKHSGGNVLASMTVPRSSISLTPGDSNGNPPMNWVKLAVPGTPTLEAGQTYHVVFSSAAGSEFRAMPAQRGNLFTPFREDKLLSLGKATYSKNSGVSWTDWPVSWGSGYDRSWSLPVLLSLS